MPGENSGPSGSEEDGETTESGSKEMPARPEDQRPDSTGEGSGSQQATLNDLQAQMAELAKALERTTTRLQRREEAAMEGARGRHASRRRADPQAGSSEEGRPRRARKAARQAASPAERSDPASGDEADAEELAPAEEAPRLKPAKTARNAPDKGGKSARSGARSKAHQEGCLQVTGDPARSSDPAQNPAEGAQIRDAVVLATAIASALRDLDAKRAGKNEEEEVIDLSTPAPVSPPEFAVDQATATGYEADEAQAAEAKWAAEMAASGAWDPTGGAAPPFYHAGPGWYAAQAAPPAPQAGPQGPVLPEAAAPAPFPAPFPAQQVAMTQAAQLPAQSYAEPSASPQDQFFHAGAPPSGPFGSMLPAGASAGGQPGQNAPLPVQQGRVTQTVEPPAQGYVNPAPGCWWAPGQPIPGGYRGALLQGLPLQVSGGQTQENDLLTVCENPSVENSNLIQNLFANSVDQQGLAHPVGGDSTHLVGGDITHQTGGDITHQVGGDTVRGPSTSTHQSGGDTHTKVQNVGPKPHKWNGDTPFLAFRMQLVLHFKAIGLPK